MEKEVVRVWFCNRRQKEKRISCPMPSPIKSPIYNSRLVRDFAERSSTCRPSREGKRVGGCSRVCWKRKKDGPLPCSHRPLSCWQAPPPLQGEDCTRRSVQGGSWASHGMGIHSTFQLEWNLMPHLQNIWFYSVNENSRKNYTFPRSVNCRIIYPKRVLLQNLSPRDW